MFFTSDIHFNHKTIVDRQPRPWDNVHDMNAALIDNWNRVVSKSDTVYVIGDFAYDNGVMPIDKIYKALKGRKHLVAGNHDYQWSSVLELPWESVTDLKSVRFENGTWATLCHYPLEVWQGNSRGSYMLHGHSHGTLKRELANRVDVGVDCWDYTPVHEDEVQHAYTSLLAFQAQDMHGEYDYAAYVD